MQDLYKVLKVSPRADSSAIADAYERLLAGVNGDGEARRQLDDAFAVLSDEEKRREYDVDRSDPRKLRALLAVDGRKEQIVWNMQGRSGRKAAPPPKPVDPWTRSAPQSRKPKRKQPTKKVKPDQPVILPAANGASVEGEDVVWEAVTERTLAAADLVESPTPEWPNAESIAAIVTESPQQAEPGMDVDVAYSDPAAETLAGSETTSADEADRSTLEPDGAATIAPGEVSSEPTSAGRPARAGKSTAATEVAKPRPRAAKSASRRRRQNTEAPPEDPPDIEPMDPEATTLTSWHPEMAAPKRSPYWNPINILAQLSFTVAIVGATVGVYLLWQMLDVEEDRVESRPPLSPDVLEVLAAPPAVASASQLPESLVRYANTTVSAYRGPDGRTYEVMGVAATQTLDGSFFYAAVGRDEGSLDGTGQRVFFFLDDRFVGTDWDIDTRSIAGLVSLVDGQIRVSYREFAPYDSTCCPSLPDYVVTFTYDGSLQSDQSQPPPQVFRN